jgi:hypothetical protein
MSGIGPILSDNGAFTVYGFETVQDTADAVPQLLISVPVDKNTALLVELRVVVRDLNSNAGLAADGRVLFGRGSGTTVVRAAALTQDVLANSFGAPAPSLDAVVNGQQVDITITGKAATALRWWIAVKQSVTR